MASSKLPTASQDAQDTQNLLSNLNLGTKKAPGGSKTGFSCKSTTHSEQGVSGKYELSSWKFQDWDYKRDDLPTYARGLFFGNNEKGEPEIVARGYDKFFNIDEVKQTRWRSIEENTLGPFELSLKENGCIIFISGLHDGTLLVCSKHSTKNSHALAAEKWVDKQLHALGKTREDLARELRNRNATAVSELCDDDFEEHILAYTKEDAGLYLHGININIPQFMTYSGEQVQAFADEWGFRKTDFLVKETLTETRSFLEEVAETGHYNGRDVEGFVIRCKGRVNGKSLYSDWFFKYKFEEPYLMYRQWRECTKALIDRKPPRFRKHVKITEEYLLFARKRLNENSQLGAQYQANHGIIALRNDFLKEINMKGSDLVREEYAAMGSGPGDVSKNVILVPIATLGCGKTTLAIALQHLFNWGIVQNDNITGKNRPPRFTKLILDQLEEGTPVVIADRNNAQKHERKQILDDVRLTHPHVRLVALHYVHSKDALDKIKQVTQDRVLSRGDNHQTIQAASDPRKVIGIMEGFHARFEPASQFASPDDGFDSMIELNPAIDSRQNLETVISQLNTLYPKLFTDMPSSEDLDEAIKFAMGEYKPDLRHVIGGRAFNTHGDRGGKTKDNARGTKGAQKKKPLEYISICLQKKDVLETLNTAFSSIPSEKSKFYETLRQTGRVQPEFHVTLMHRANAKEHPDLWQKYSEMYADAVHDSSLGYCKIILERVVWDSRIMAIVVRLVDDGFECSNEVAHITVGTRDKDVKPKESNDLLQSWLRDGSGDHKDIGEVAIQDRKVVNGTVKGILAR